MSKLFEMRPAKIPDCVELLCDPKEDARGCFVKTYHEDAWRELGLNMVFGEQNYSVSSKGVLRGMHFQLPPRDHDKAVTCIVGCVLDVVVDLRKGSPTFGQAEGFELSFERHNVLFVPRGLAHGFYVLSETAIVSYSVSTVYNPQLDAGIRWDSLAFDWPDPQPLLSDRDRQLPLLKDFDSPFEFSGYSTARLKQAIDGA